MNKLFIILLIVTSLSFSGTVTYLAAQSATLSHQVSIVCQEHRTLAQIAREEVSSIVAANEKYLRPDVNIPGLSHQELIESTETRLASLRGHVVKLEAVRKATC